MPRKIRMKKSTMLKKIITTIYFMYVIFMTSFVEVYSVEWDCTSSTNTGTFTRSTGCTISGNNHVAVSNTLAINGTNTDMNNLITITATTNKRHFFLNNANAKLILRYLKLVGGDVSSYSDSHARRGGSIYIQDNGGELNLYSSIVFNNKAVFGGGIYPRGASNTNKNAIMNIFNSIIQNNEATWDGGGIYMLYAVCTIDNTTIDNNQAGGQYSGGGMRIVDSDVTMKNTIISNNDAGDKGGGLSIQGDSSTVTLRQSSFINNNATGSGDEIWTYNSPTISLINTYFNNPNNNNNIYEDTDAGTPTWKTCSNNLCTEDPFTGTCNAVNNGNSKLGVLCNLNCSANLFAPLVSVAISAPSSSDTCKPWQKCDAGYKRVNGNATSDSSCVQCGQGQFQPLNQFNGTACQLWQDIKCNAGYKRVNGNATFDANCVQCSQGQFQPLNQFNETNCTNWKQCNNNEYISFNGNRTFDRVCVLKETTTTAAPTTTTAAPTTTVAVTTTTSAAPVSLGNTTSAAPLPPAGTTTVAATFTATTTTNSARSRSSNTGNGNDDEEEELSNSIVNTMSRISMIIVFMIVIYNL